MTARVSSRDVILRDGRTLRLCPPTPADVAALTAFFERLSDTSLYFRFHGHPAVGPALVRPFLGSGNGGQRSLMGTLVEDGKERVVALASWIRLRDPAVAEVAFAVEDALQGIGLGTRLLEQLAESAAAEGVERFVAEVLPENRAMLTVFESAGFEVARAIEGGTVEVRFAIAPTAAYRAEVDRRDHTAVVASLEPFFRPSAVAVVGASARPRSIGGLVVRNLVAGGFPGHVCPVNRSGTPVAGLPAVASVSEIPGTVDMAVICVPAAVVHAAVAEALAAGVRAVCVISAGFAETGKEGGERQERLLALVRGYGVRLLGPNCLGLAVTASSLNATFAGQSFPPGPIGLASQSGALGLALLEAAGGRGLGFSAFVSVGNKADVSTNDLLEFWEDDPSTRVVLLYVESFGNPRKFGRVAQRLARHKPLLAMKAGSSSAGARAASSHTAAIAGSEAAVDALFHQAGVIRASTLEELLDVASLYSTGMAPEGRRVGVLTNAGGLGILCADACEANGLELPRLAEDSASRLASFLPSEASLANPVDMLGSATPESYLRAVPVVLGDPGVDALIVLFVPAAGVHVDEVAEAVVRGVAASGEETKPVLAAVLSDAGIPAVLRRPGGRIAPFSYPESAARALGRAAARADWLRRPAGIVPEPPEVELVAARALVAEALGRSADGWLGPTETARLLGCFGVPVVAERVAGSPEEAVAAAEELGFPVAVKSGVPGIHKTDVGGVALDLGGVDAVAEAASRIGPPVVVQPMLEGGVELLAGLVQDPVFGPLVGFGPGGRLAELIGEATFRIAPLTDVDAHELVFTGKAGILVRGFRGAPAVDVTALTDLVHRLGLLGEELPEVADLDLNPVLGFPDGCVAVDARVRVREPASEGRTKTW